MGHFMLKLFLKLYIIFGTKYDNCIHKSRKAHQNAHL